MKRMISRILDGIPNRPGRIGIVVVTVAGSDMSEAGGSPAVSSFRTGRAAALLKLRKLARMAAEELQRSMPELFSRVHVYGSLVLWYADQGISAPHHVPLLPSIKQCNPQTLQSTKHHSCHEYHHTSEPVTEKFIYHDNHL